MVSRTKSGCFSFRAMPEAFSAVVIKNSRARWRVARKETPETGTIDEETLPGQINFTTLLSKR